MSSPRLIADRYRLDHEIGRGSMGVVWDAYDVMLRRRVAVKEVSLPKGLPAGDVEQLQNRTLREARSIGALSHPHVITLYDILPLESGPAIVMELMVAPSLAHTLSENGRVDDGSAAVIGAAISSGLLAAHRAGITHRDIKPANVLISAEGVIKLTDFGIARAAGEQTLTATGLLLGSPAYIAPEVASGKPATPAADAWGLGALLYAAVEGHPPFDEGDPIATLSAVVSDPVPPARHAGRLTPVIDALLVKDPRARMPMEQAAQTLSQLAVGAQLQIPTGTFGPQRAQPLAGSELRPGNNASGAAHTPAPRPAQVPPPWETSGAAPLPPIPAVASPAKKRWLLIAAVAVGIMAAAAGFVEVMLLAGVW